MHKVSARKLRPWEGQKLKGMKRQLSNAVNSRHARVILLSCGGLTNRQIAERCDCTPTWVRQIIHRFNQGGIDAITWYPYYCGCAGPRKFIADQIEQICEVALSPPQGTDWHGRLVAAETAGVSDCTEDHRGDFVGMAAAHIA